MFKNRCSLLALEETVKSVTSLNFIKNEHGNIDIAKRGSIADSTAEPEKEILRNI